MIKNSYKIDKCDEGIMVHSDVSESRRLMRADTGRMIASLTPEQNSRTRLKASKEFRQAPLPRLQL